MQQTNNQTVRAIEAIETVLSDQFDQEIEYTRLVRISKEISKFGGVFDEYSFKNGVRE